MAPPHLIADGSCLLVLLRGHGRRRPRLVAAGGRNGRLRMRRHLARGVGRGARGGTLSVEGASGQAAGQHSNRLSVHGA